jgi:hypothetical protein
MRRIERDGTETTLLHLKAPVELFERLDVWCEWMQRAKGMTLRPTRPAAIRYILDQYLQRQEKQAARPKSAGKRKGLKR